MKFNEYETKWDRLGKLEKRDHGDDPYEFYNRENERDDCRNNDTALIVHSMESTWCQYQKPYYRLYPEKADAIARTSLTMPVQSFKVPYDAYCVYMPDIHDPLYFGYDDDMPRLRSLLVWNNGTLYLERTRNSAMSIIADFGSERRRLVFGCGFGRCSTIEDWVSNFGSGGDTGISRAFVAVMARIAIGVAYLATNNDDCIEHDVLAKYRKRYDEETTEHGREAIAEKSRRRRQGQIGWLMGRHLHLEHKQARSDALGEGRELTYQNWRCEHHAWQAYGPGYTLRRRILRKATIVRPDLPVRPYDKVVA